MDDLLESGALAPELLGALGIVPNAGFGEFQFDFSQAFAALIDVKDTPSARRCVPRCP
jgi:hypothetical protein